MDNMDAPYHAHIYYVLETRAVVETLQLRLSEMQESGPRGPHEPGPLDRKTVRTRPDDARSSGRQPGHRAFLEIGFLSVQSHAERPPKTC